MLDQTGAWLRSQEVAFVDDGDRVVLLSLTGDGETHPVVLSGSARAVWNALADKRSALDIARAIGVVAEVPLNQVVQETERFLERLRELGLAQQL